MSEQVSDVPITPGPHAGSTTARTAAVLSAFVALAAGAILAPATYGAGDSPDLTLALATAGVPHPTGYPIWTLVGHVFVRALHACGLAWPHAANLWSVAGAAVAVGLFVRLTVRLADAEGMATRHAVAAGTLAATLLAANPAWLAGATQAEVDSWHWAWLAWAIAAAYAGQAMLRADGALTAQRAARAGLQWGLVCAVGLGHHRTSLAFLLPLTVLLAASRLRASAGLARWVVGAAVGASAAVLPYAWVAWRAHHPAPAQWPLLEPNWASLSAHLRGTIYLVLFGGFTPGEDDAARLRLGVWPLLPFALAGVSALAWRARSTATRDIALAIGGAVVLQLSFVLFYGVPDPTSYFVPALLAGLVTWPAALAIVPEPRRVAALGVLWVATATALLAWLPAAWRECREVLTLDRNIRMVWRRVPLGSAIVLWRSDQYARLRAYQVLERQRPEVVVDNPDVLTWEPARRAFERRTGIDPLLGLRLREQADVEQIAANVARQSRVPTLRFEDLARR